MSLRYRLFLAVSALFVVVAACSYVIENAVTHRGLKKAQHDLREKIIALSEKNRIDLQSFLASVLAENQERLNAILMNLSGFTPQILRFAPTTSNYEKGTWKESADLLFEYKWLDFLQNTNQGKIASAILQRQNSNAPAFRLPIDEDLSWVYLDDDSSAFLGIRVPYTLTSRMASDSLEVPEKFEQASPVAYLLFAPQEIIGGSRSASNSRKANEKPISLPWTEGFEIDIAPLATTFQRARELLLQHQLQPPALEKSVIKKKMAELNQDLYAQSLQASGETAQEVNVHLEKIALDYTQTSLIWIFLAIAESGVFGEDLFHFPMPSALTLFHAQRQVGVGVEASQVLFSHSLFDDQEYFAKNPPATPQSNLAASLAVIAFPQEIYLGNTAQFLIKTISEERVGYLTLGVGVESVLQKLIFAVRQMAIMVHAGKPICQFTANGEKTRHSLETALPFTQMLQQKSGVVPLNGENYFFIHLQPFPEIDLHFFLFNPESVQFALLQQLQAGSQKIIDSVLFDIHLAGLGALVIAILLLHAISRKVTSPIIQLAQATKKIEEGKLEDIRLSLPPLKHNDEIAVLCHSFEEMVNGLKEKEKVKGVLNKVVSREIAQEILKGTIHLGGEEKKVTVLFADIREFTKMTQTMLPAQVIDLLNVCMTKISAVVDKNGGVIDKFVGDEAMALFGAPLPRDDSAYQAIATALEILEVLKNWNSERKMQGSPEVEMGIGIHTGRMLVGNMGAENRLNYTVIGSNVNLAFRLCSAAKRMEILVTKDTLDEPFVKERVDYEPLTPMTFKGIDKAIEIFRITRLK